MVALSNAMILWTEDRGAMAGDHPAGVPKIRVVDIRARDNRKYDYLLNSVGACFGGWQTCNDVARAAYLMGLFNRIVTEDGLSSEEVHKAFMEIEEYAEFHDPNAGEDARRLNPFWKLHWGWSTTAAKEAA